MNSIAATLRSHRWLLVFILLICVCAAFFKIAYVGLTPNSDYVSYVETAKVFSGIPAVDYPQRILKPLAPLGVTLLAPVFGFANAFIIEVVLFYIAFAIAFYFLAVEFFGNKSEFSNDKSGSRDAKRLALIATLLIALSYPMFRYGLDLYTETGAQFFYVLSLLFTLKYLKTPSRTLLAINALVIGLGMLWKEYSIVSGLIFGIVLLIESSPLIRKIQNLVLLGVISLLPTILVQFWVFVEFHYSYVNWYVAGGASGFKTQFTIGNLVKSVAALLGLAWLLVPLSWPDLKTLGTVRQRFLIISILSSFVAFLWGYVSSRLFFIMAPPFVLLAVLGLTRVPRKFHWAVVIVIILGNILWLLISTKILH